MCNFCLIIFTPASWDGQCPRPPNPPNSVATMPPSPMPPQLCSPPRATTSTLPSPFPYLPDSRRFINMATFILPSSRAKKKTCTYPVVSRLLFVLGERKTQSHPLPYIRIYVRSKNKFTFCLTRVRQRAACLQSGDAWE